MSNAVAGVGTKFRRWDGSEWEDIAEVLSITGPSPNREFIDVTNLDSTGGYREFIGSFRDGGTVSLSMNFARATYDLMKADFEDDDLQNYEIIFPDTEETTVEFTGFVTEIPLTVSPDSQITTDVTIKVSGEVTVNSGSAASVA